MPPAQGTIVLGPFRSGTSLTCRMLDRLGLDFGPASSLWRADRYNPGGFYERLDVNHANGRLLESIGRTIVDPVDPREVLEHSDRSVLSEADLSWRGRSKRGGRWALKDPRLCMTLAAWVDAGHLDPGRLRLIVVRRGAAAVIASILGYPTLEHLLDGDAGRAGALVEACDRGASWHVERLGRPALVVDYDRLVAEPAAVAQELSAFVEAGDRPAIAAAVAEVGKRRALLRYYARRLGRKLGVGRSGRGMATPMTRAGKPSALSDG